MTAMVLYQGRVWVTDSDHELHAGVIICLLAHRVMHEGVLICSTSGNTSDMTELLYGIHTALHAETEANSICNCRHSSVCNCRDSSARSIYIYASIWPHDNSFCTARAPTSIVSFVGPTITSAERREGLCCKPCSSVSPAPALMQARPSQAAASPVGPMQ